MLAFILIALSGLLAGLALLNQKQLSKTAKRLSPDIYFRLEAGAVALLFLLLGIFAAGGGSASMSVSAESEKLVVTIAPNDRPPHWGRPDAIRALGGESLASDCERPSLRFAPDRKASISATFLVLRPALSKADDNSVALAATGKASGSKGQRASSDAALAQADAEMGIMVILKSDATGDLLLSCGSAPAKAAPATLRLDYLPSPGNPRPTLALNGDFRIGGEVADAIINERARATPILLSGWLSVEARSWPMRSGLARSEVPLRMGDIVYFEDEGEAKKAAISTGIVRPGEQALAIVAFSESSEAKIARRGLTDTIAAGYAPSLWMRMQAMSEWAIVIALGALLIYLIGAVERLASHLRSGSES